MKFKIKVRDPRTDESREVEVEAESREEALREARRRIVEGNGTQRAGMTVEREVEAERRAEPVNSGAVAAARETAVAYSAGLSPATPPARYPSMLALASGYRVLAVICAFAAMAGALGGVLLVEKQTAVGAAVIIASVVWGAVSFVSLMAMAEGIGLATDMEATLREIRDRLPTENTRG